MNINSKKKYLIDEFNYLEAVNERKNLWLDKKSMKNERKNKINKTKSSKNKTREKLIIFPHFFLLFFFEENWENLRIIIIIIIIVISRLNGPQYSFVHWILIPDPNLIFDFQTCIWSKICLSCSSFFFSSNIFK